MAVYLDLAGRAVPPAPGSVMVSGDRSGQSERWRRVGEYLFRADGEEPVDLAICLGCTCYHKTVGRAIDLYQRGFCRRLLFSGGFNAKIDGNEARLMAQLAVSGGVAASDVLIEDCSTNTLENAEHSLRLLEEACGGLPAHPLPARVGLVCIHYHTRRAYETFRMVFGDACRLSTLSFPSSFYGSANWFDSPRGRRDVANELRRIEAYLPPSRTAALQAILQAASDLSL